MLLALLPASAFGQSAGDEQYADPFGDEQQQSQDATPTPAPAQAQAPATPAAPAAQAAPAAAAPSAAAAPAQAGQLPRTGWDAALPGTLGLIFLAAGVALRARVRRAQ